MSTTGKQTVCAVSFIGGKLRPSQLSHSSFSQVSTNRTREDGYTVTSASPSILHFYNAHLWPMSLSVNDSVILFCEAVLDGMNTKKETTGLPTFSNGYFS